MGANAAHPEYTRVCIDGNASFQMTACELATVTITRMAELVIVTYNYFLAMVRQWQELFYDRTYSEVEMVWLPDFVKLAEAYGATGLRVTRPAELRAALERGLATPGVVVMDVLVAAEENVYPMIPPGAGLREMVLS
jgi:acetolactate synthase-1/2/3 large subunit